MAVRGRFLKPAARLVGSRGGPSQPANPKRANQPNRPNQPTNPTNRPAASQPTQPTQPPANATRGAGKGRALFYECCRRYLNTIAAPPAQGIYCGGRLRRFQNFTRPSRGGFNILRDPREISRGGFKILRDPRVVDLARDIPPLFSRAPDLEFRAVIFRSYFGYNGYFSVIFRLYFGYFSVIFRS